MIEETEESLNLAWANAKAKFDFYQMINTNGKTPIELAKINMQNAIAQKEFQDINNKVKDYVEKITIITNTPIGSMR